MIQILTNPFSVYSDKKLLLSGLLLFTASVLFAMVFNVRRDGILDVHFIHNVDFGIAIAEALINMAILSILLYVAGKLINTKTRLLDICITALIALPVFVFLFFFNIQNTMSIIGNQLTGMAIDNEAMQLITDNLILILVFALVGILILVWFLALTYNGFKVATNAKGTKSTLLFIASILIAEILSKIIIHQLV